MSILRAAQLSCDVYKPKQRLLKSYMRNGIQVIERENYPLLMSVQDASNLYIAFRGCKDVNEFIECIDTKLVKPIKYVDAKINNVYWNTYKDIENDLEHIIATHDITEIQNIVFTGHSKGGALAQIASSMLHLKDTGAKVKKCITFGAPYVGDKGFLELIGQTTHENKRVVAHGDIIPIAKLHRELVHNGDELRMNTTIQSSLNCIDHHSCQNYINIAKKYEQNLRLENL
jgi:hypothetical protein